MPTPQAGTFHHRGQNVHVTEGYILSVLQNVTPPGVYVYINVHTTLAWALAR